MAMDFLEDVWKQEQNQEEKKKLGALQWLSGVL